MILGKRALLFYMTYWDETCNNKDTQRKWDVVINFSEITWDKEECRNMLTGELCITDAISCLYHQTLVMMNISIVPSFVWFTFVNTNLFYRPDENADKTGQMGLVLVWNKDRMRRLSQLANRSIRMLKTWQSL